MLKKVVIVGLLTVGVFGVFLARNAPAGSEKAGTISDRTSQLDSLLNRASELSAEGKFTELIEETEKGERIASKGEIDHYYLAAFLQLRGGAYFGLGDYTRAISIYNEAIAATSDDEDGLNERAMALFERANAEYQLDLLADCYRTSLESEEILVKLKHPDYDYLVSVYVDLAYQSRELAFYDDALLFIKKARRVYDEHQEEIDGFKLAVRKPVSFAYNEVLINSEDQNETGMLEALQLLETYTQNEDASLKEKIRLSSAYMAVADYYINDLPDFSEEKLRKAKHYLQLTQKTYNGKYEPQVEQMIFNEAKMHYFIGQFNKAKKGFDELMVRAKPTDLRMPFFQVMQGFVHMKLHKPEAAKSYFRNAIEFVHQGDEELLSDASNYRPGTNIAHASLFAEVADTITNFDQFQYDTIARQLYLAGIRELEANYGGTTFNERLEKTYESLFGGMLEPIIIKKEGKEKAKELAAIIDQSENIENQLLWSKFLLNRKSGELKVPDSIRYQEQLLRLERVQARQEGNQQKWFELGKELDKLERSIASEYPKYAEFSQREFSVEKLQKGLDQKTIILKYAEFADQIYRFEISRSRLKCTELKNAVELKSQISRYVDCIKNRGEDRSLAYEIAAQLFPEKILNYEKIVVVNHLIFGALPFEALCDESETYLVEKTLISYAPHLIFTTNDAENEQKDGELIVFYPSYSKLEQNLPGAKEESKSIANRFKSKLYENKFATREVFLKESEKASVLHLSMHAEISEKKKEQSSFIFSDDKVYLEELYGMNLNGQMAVLSACNTGKSFVDLRNGSASLQRAFMYAGIPSTVSSLWEIPDQSTNRIMDLFYDNLHAGMTNVEAINEAKKLYLSQSDDPKLQSPYFWAGFVLSGQEQKILLTAEDDSSKIWTILLCILFASGLGFLVWRIVGSKKRLAS